MDYDTFLSILSVTATSSTFALFLCGLQVCSHLLIFGYNAPTQLPTIADMFEDKATWLNGGNRRSAIPAHVDQLCLLAGIRGDPRRLHCDLR